MHLRQLLSVQAGGVVFTTIQKFFPKEEGDCHPARPHARGVAPDVPTTGEAAWSCFAPDARREAPPAGVGVWVHGWPGV